jgi:hypothetical protein
MPVETVQSPSAARSTIASVDLDPNWFYSTLAQSTAAMVGLAGGFLVQRLLAQRSDIAQERADLRANAEAVFSTAASHRKVAARVIEAMDAALVEIHAQEQSGAMQFEGQTYAQLFSLSHGENNWGGVPIPSVDFQLARHQVVETREVATGLRDALDRTPVVGPPRVRVGG